MPDQGTVVQAFGTYGYGDSTVGAYWDALWGQTKNVLNTEWNTAHDVMSLPGTSLDLTVDTYTGTKETLQKVAASTKETLSTAVSVAPYAISGVAIIAALVAIAYVVRAFK